MRAEIKEKRVTLWPRSAAGTAWRGWNSVRGA
jgi:hypothetical protein